MHHEVVPYRGWERSKYLIYNAGVDVDVTIHKTMRVTHCNRFTQAFIDGLTIGHFSAVCWDGAFAIMINAIVDVFDDDSSSDTHISS